MSEGNPEFRKVLDAIWQMHLKKGSDYGTHEDSLTNVRSAKDFGVPNWLGAVIRANDKMSRLKTFAKSGKLENESVEDSLMDLASYAILALVLYRE